MRKITKLTSSQPDIKRRKRVCAYARVSEQKGRTLHSLSQQISYFSELIQGNSEWEYVGVYADKGISGTSDNRDEFKRMLEDCKNGKIDLILTKSISRFARNTVDLLEIIRDLKDKSIEVYFEKENINSMSDDGELMLTLLASFAQEESRSISENVKWGIRKNFERGIGNNFILYGYQWDGENFNLIEEEAKVVRYCFDNFLDQKSAETTAKELEARGVVGRSGKPIHPETIRSMLRQEKYTGNSLLQKTYINNHIEKKETINTGELPMYWVEGTHPQIIDLETFENVQDEIARRRELGVFANWAIKTNCFTSKIHCSCGRNFQRNQRNNRSSLGGKYTVWMCASQKEANRKGCINPSMPERIIKEKCCEVLNLEDFDETVFEEKILAINVLKPGLLEFLLKNGRRQQVKWQSTAKKDWWTDERKVAYAKSRSDPEFSRKIERFNEFSSFIKCEKCGRSYRKQYRYLKSGEKPAFYMCGSPASECRNSTIYLTVVQEIITRELGLEKFDGEVMREKLSHLSVKDSQLTLHFKNGQIKTYDYKNPKTKRPPMSEETKKKIGKSNRKKWREKREQKNNSYTSD